MAVERHKTALHRKGLSKPIRLAIADNLLGNDLRVFDYGCGRGEDVRQLRKRGIACDGWDPVFAPNVSQNKADIVNLGYVINVIENAEERQQVLKCAWGLANRMMIVSARLKDEVRGLEHEEFADGVRTRLNTFQRFFDQSELRNWVDSVLSVRAVPAAPGIFYVFRHEGDREAFVASRYRRRALVPRLKKSEILFEQHKEILEPLMGFVTDRGRLPVDGEFPLTHPLGEVFGSVKQAFQVVKRVTGTEDWDAIAADKVTDLQIYLALAQFDRRTLFSNLPEQIQYDVRAFFGTYAKACKASDQMLLSIGAPAAIDKACKASEIGKLTPAALYIHESALEHLSPTLRLYEGCARGYIGAVEDSNIIKLARDKPQVSYLSYPDFEKDPHPELRSAVTVNLQTFRVKNRRYDPKGNPPILHRKETMLPAEHPFRSKFERLTNQEMKWGLYDDVASIGTRRGWDIVLEQCGVRLRGHKLQRKN